MSLAALLVRGPCQEGPAVRVVALIRTGGVTLVLRATSARGRHDQGESAEDPRPGDRLAIPQRAEEGAEHMIHRRAFVQGLSLLGAASVLDLHPRQAEGESAPETTRIRLVQIAGVCVAPQYV